jgi:tryptophan synthase alpha chain
MSRLAACFQELSAKNRKALIPFITAGDPDPALTLPLMRGLVKAGADVIELGVPFSDPMADGPVIQRASERALLHHVRLADVLNMVAEFRKENATTPVVLMGYLNPIECLGYQNFAQAAQSAGVDGLLTVDLPPEEADDLVNVLRAHQLDPIFLIAPTSSDARIQRICDLASGFIYYVSLKGVTGAANLDVQSVSDKLAQIRQHTKLPVGVGFGIKDAETAAQVAKIGDAVVVGSALVRLVESQPAERLAEAVSDLLARIRQGMDGAC